MYHISNFRAYLSIQDIARTSDDFGRMKLDRWRGIPLERLRQVDTFAAEYNSRFVR